jgi:MoxR-like ATPase
LYDALGHFQAANIKRDVGQQAPQTADFIELQALGRAIALSNPAGIDPGKFKTDLPAKPLSSVVLIDEVDKAPRDFPNDLLNEIENQEFQIKELDNYTVQRGNDQRIVIVLTSNSEKNLPDAFLRRCVFYHIPFPSDQQLLQIAKAQLGDATAYTDKLLEELIAKFGLIRQRAVRKPPATAELIAWLRILELNRIFDLPDAEKQKQMRDNLLILVKTKEDLDAVKGML